MRFGDVLHQSLGGVTSFSYFPWNVQEQLIFDDQHRDNPRLSEYIYEIRSTNPLGLSLFNIGLRIDQLLLLNNLIDQQIDEELQIQELNLNAGWGGKAAISMLSRNEFLADSSVIMFPVLVFEDGPSNENAAASTNVVLDNSPIDGDMDTTVSHTDSQAIATASIDDSTAAFTDGSAAASKVGNLKKKPRRYKSRAHMKKEKRNEKNLLQSIDPANKIKHSSERDTRRKLEKLSKLEQTEERKAESLIPQLVRSSFTFILISSSTLNKIFETLSTHTSIRSAKHAWLYKWKEEEC